MYKEVQGIIERYLEFFPEEKKRLERVIRQFPLDASIVSRRNFTGHITVSAIVLSPDRKKILLVYHKQLQRFLQPGGHIEVFDKDLLDACRREVREETGLDTIELLDLVGQQSPIDIDVHLIPFNDKKNEPEHFHYDFCFVFVAKSSVVTIQEEEVEGYRWIALDEIAQIERFQSIIQKIDACLQNKKVFA